MNNNLQVIPFDKNYLLKDFDCGNSELNQYITTYASQDIKRYLASVFICISSKNKTNRKIYGFYSLSAGSVDITELSNEYTKKLPHYPYLPTILIGRLAVDKTIHKQGIGEYILMDALYRSYKSQIAAFAVIVKAKNEAAVNFHKKYDFVQFIDDSNKLFLPMKVINSIFK